MKKNVYLTLICLMILCWTKPLNATSNHKPDKIEAGNLTGAWFFEKAEILQKQPDAQSYTVKETIDQIADMPAFSFCFHQALTNLVFISENRLSFESLDTPTTETEYRLISLDNGETLLEIFIQKEDQEIPIPTGFEYKISLTGADRLAITVETVCLNGEFIVSYFKRIF